LDISRIKRFVTVRSRAGSWSSLRAARSNKVRICRLIFGNLTLWSKSCRPYNRTSTESSNLPLSLPSPSAPHLYLSAGIVEIHSRSLAHRSVVEQKGRCAWRRRIWRGHVSKFTRLCQNQLDQARWIDPTFGQQFTQDTIFLTQDGLRNCPFVNRC